MGLTLEGIKYFSHIDSILIPDFEHVLPELSVDDSCCDTGTVHLSIYS